MDQTPKEQVTEVQFNEPVPTTRAAASEKASITDLLVNSGIAKDTKGAEKILIGIAVLAVLGIIWVWVGSMPPKQKDIPSPARVDVTTYYDV